MMITSRRFAFVATPAFLLLFGSMVCADPADWPHWRGPQFNGSSGESRLPANWSMDENIRWKTALPGPGAATPIVWKDRVFVSSTNTKTEGLVSLCLSRTSGKILWQRDVENSIRKDTRSTFAAPSPVTNGSQVVFFYGNGDLLAFDFTGKLLWQRNIQKDFGDFAFLWTFSSSPLLFDGRLYLQVLQRDVAVRGAGFEDRTNESYLLALDPRNGKELWRHVRPSQAVAESREAFSSPIPHSVNGQPELLVVGGDDLSGHDPATGRELWRWGTWNPTRISHWRLVPSPVAERGVILACGPKRSPIFAVRSGQKGHLTDRALAWDSAELRDVSADVPTPAADEGDFFVLSDVRGKLSRVEAKTGRVKWSVSTPGVRKYEASPTVADGKVYLVNFDGLVVVVRAENGEILNQIPMDVPSESPVRSSVAVAHGNLFIRMNAMLYCVGSDSP